MRIIMIFVNDFLIVLRKALKILFILKTLNFFCLFIMFRMFFLIILENNSTACSYSKFSMSFKSAYNFFEKKLCHIMSAFFCVMKTVFHLKQSLNNIVVSEQQCDS